MSFNENFERVRARLHNRVFCYRAVFSGPEPVPADWRFWRKPDPRPLGPAAEVVMKDLAAYCYAGKPTLKVSHVTQQSDALAMAFAEGRRDVFNRITAMLNLTQDQIERIAHARSQDD